MAYHEGLPEESKDQTPVYKKISDHKVGRILKNLGYRYIHIGSKVNFSRKSMVADTNICQSMLPEFIWQLYSTSMAERILEELDMNLCKKTGYKWILFQLQAISNAIKAPKPVFIFAHILVPHNPFVFDEKGVFQSHNVQRRIDKKTLYINQVKYINGEILKLVDTLLAVSGPKPVIIVQSDEGPPYAGTNECFEKNTSTGLSVRTGILNAMYLPEVDTSGISRQITSVNTFRLVLKKYINENVRLLPDKVYFFDWKKPYKFKEITDSVITMHEESNAGN